MRRGLIILLLLLAVVTAVFFLSPLYDGVKHNKAQYDIRQINNDSIQKYYGVFRLKNYLNDYSKDDFLRYVWEYNSNLGDQLSISDIELNSRIDRLNTHVLEGFYHKGVKRNSSKDDIYFYVFSTQEIAANTIYTIEGSKLTEESGFNIHNKIKLSLNCIENGVPLSKYEVVDTKTLLYSAYMAPYVFSQVIKSDEGQILFSENTDNKVKDVILNDSEFLALTKNTEILFLNLKYYPIDSYFCKTPYNSSDEKRSKLK